MNNPLALKDKRKDGQAALATVFLIGGVVILFALTLAFLALRITASTYSAEAANRAAAAATAGAEDAVLQIVRNFKYNGSYDLTVNQNQQAHVVVTSDWPNGQATITSSANAGLNRRAVEVVLSITSSTGEVSVVSWKDQQ